jgi:dihydrofolate reductase
MKKPTISMIAAVGKNTLAIGKNNRLLWNLPDDLKHFKKVTFGHPVIMGSKTYESIGKALPGRLNIVVNQDVTYKCPDCVVENSIEKAMETAAKHDGNEIFIIGGGQVYKYSLPFADKLYLTLVESDEDGDTFFPDWKNFGEIVSEEKRTDEKTGLKYSWVEIVKKIT